VGDIVKTGKDIYETVKPVVDTVKAFMPEKGNYNTMSWKLKKMREKENGFFDVLKDVASVVGPIVKYWKYLVWNFYYTCTNIYSCQVVTYS